MRVQMPGSRETGELVAFEVSLILLHFSSWLSGIVLLVCFLLFQLVVGSWEKVFKVRLRGEEKYLDISPALHSITTIATIIILECVSRRSFCCRDLSACCTVPRFMLGGVCCPFVLFLPFHCETI